MAAAFLFYTINKMRNPAPSAATGFRHCSLTRQLQRLGERCLPEIDFSPGTPNLHLRDVVNIFGNGNALVNLVAFDLKALEQVGMAMGVHSLPMRGRSIWGHEIIREGQDVLTALHGVRDRA